MTLVLFLPGHNNDLVALPPKQWADLCAHKPGPSADHNFSLGFQCISLLTGVGRLLGGDNREEPGGQERPVNRPHPVGRSAVGVKHSDCLGERAAQKANSGSVRRCRFVTFVFVLLLGCATSFHWMTCAKATHSKIKIKSGYEIIDIFKLAIIRHN